MLAANGWFNVVYHLTTINQWQALCREQLAALHCNRRIRSLRVTIAATCDEAGAEAGQLLNGSHRRSGYLLSHQICRPGDFEHPALEYVDGLARRDDAPVLYFHMKGVSYSPPDPLIEAWRTHLNRFVSEGDRWAAFLAGQPFDACGPMRFADERHGFTYFAGNVWMARASYLRTLPPYAEFVRCPPQPWFAPGSRYLAEVAINRTRRMRSFATDGTLLSRKSFGRFLQQLRDSSEQRG